MRFPPLAPLKIYHASLCFFLQARPTNEGDPREAMEETRVDELQREEKGRGQVRRLDPCFAKPTIT